MGARDWFLLRQNFPCFSDAASLAPSYLISTSYQIRLHLIRCNLFPQPCGTRSRGPLETSQHASNPFHHPQFDSDTRGHHGVATQQNTRIPVALPGSMGLERVGRRCQGRDSRRGFILINGPAD